MRKRACFLERRRSISRERWRRYLVILPSPRALGTRINRNGLKYPLIDLKIHLFDFHQEDLERPSWTFVGPTENVFSLAFSANNTHIYCGSTGRKLYKYDLTTLGEISGSPMSPLEVLEDHADTIRDVTCHPFQSELTMTARWEDHFAG